jgi:beta-galactosidase/beta-glucuronidase
MAYDLADEMGLLIWQSSCSHGKKTGVPHPKVAVILVGRTRIHMAYDLADEMGLLIWQELMFAW